MRTYYNKYDSIFQFMWCHIPINMMPYSNKYDAIPICRTHARTEPVRTPKFSSDNASDKRQFCRLSLALSLPVRSHPMVCDQSKYIILYNKNIFICIYISKPHWGGGVASISPQSLHPPPPAPISDWMSSRRAKHANKSNLPLRAPVRSTEKILFCTGLY